MNRYSILLNTTLFFILIFIIINALLFFYNFSLQNKIISLEANRYSKAIKVLNNSSHLFEDIYNLLKPYDLELIKDNNLKSKVFVDGKRLFDDTMISIFNYKNDRYLSVQRAPILMAFLQFKKSKKFKELVLEKNMDEKEAFRFFINKKRKKGDRLGFVREKNKVNSFSKALLFKDVSISVHLLKKQKIYLYFFTVVIDLLLITFYLFLYRKIKPLNSLKKNISKFAMGDLNIRTNMKSKDEIAEVANEFDFAIARIKELSDSRNLFLRNIMHELKTPITKGKLIADTLDNNRKKQILQKTFYRLQYLLGEFAKIEELTSGKIQLKKHNFIVEELINQAMDILLVDDSKINITLMDKIVNVDFELFSIALKNLIDNSIKYNTNGNPEIIVTSESITIRNKGEKLNKDISEYFKPFNREYESIEKGLGLGLYITNSIVKIHGFKLQYLYEKEYHNFKIIF